jgi:hypothetical protein
MYLWAAYVGLLLGCGWWKDAENREDIQRQSKWQAYIGELRIEAKQHFDEVIEWMRLNSSHPDSRQAFQQWFSSDYTGTTLEEGDREEYKWVHAKFGFKIEATFLAEHVVGHGGHWGSGDIEQIHPAPPVVRFTSLAERIRRFAASWLAWAWVLLLPFALFSRRYGMVAAQAGLAVAMAYAVAQLTAPNYSLTSQGIFSNDPLVMAALMFLSSVVLLAKRSPTSPQPLRQMKFRLRSILLVTTMCAIAAAAGPLGLVAMIAFLFGLLLYISVLALKTPLAGSADSAHP